MGQNFKNCIAAQAGARHPPPSPLLTARRINIPSLRFFAYFFRPRELADHLPRSPLLPTAPRLASHRPMLLREHSRPPKMLRRSLQTFTRLLDASDSATESRLAHNRPFGAATLRRCAMSAFQSLSYTGVNRDNRASCVSLCFLC